MRKVLVGSALALLVLACSPGNQASETHVATSGCSATASATWQAGLAGDFRVEASAAGSNCGAAAATLTIRDPSGGTRWTEEYPAAQVMTLAGATSSEDMQAKLGDWINPSAAAYHTTADLPEWTRDEDNPMSGEFPFYPEEGIDRAAYEALRGRAVPVYCYVQGMESLACLAWENGELQKVGLQTFPG